MLCRNVSHVNEASQFAPPSPWVMQGGVLSHFSTVFIQEGLRLNQEFGWDLAVQVGVIFFRWDLKTPRIKNSEYIHILSKNEKNNSYCNFYNFSLLVPQPNKFVVVCICIIIFHGIYFSLSPNIFLVGGYFFFFCILQLGRGNISNFLVTSCIGGPNFLFRGGRLGHIP